MTAPRCYALKWSTDDNPFWEAILEEDGELRMGRLSELDRWLMDEVLG